MIDVRVLKGARIRGVYGGVGSLGEVSLPWVRLCWEERGIVREETLRRGDPKLDFQVEILTLDRGWIPLGSLVGSYPQAEEIQQVVHGLLSEAGKRYPFKRKKHLGPGPRAGENDKTDHWACTCGNYRCTCKGKGDMRGRTRTVVIDRGYKKAYNQEFKAWLKKKGKKSRK